MKVGLFISQQSPGTFAIDDPERKSGLSLKQKIRQRKDMEDKEKEGK